MGYKVEPQWGPREESMVRVGEKGAKPPEAGGIFIFQKCKWGANLSILGSSKLLKYTLYKNIVAFLFGVILQVITL